MYIILPKIYWQKLRGIFPTIMDYLNKNVFTSNAFQCLSNKTYCAKPRNTKSNFSFLRQGCQYSRKSFLRRTRDLSHEKVCWLHYHVVFIRQSLKKNRKNWKNCQKFCYHRCVVYIPDLCHDNFGWMFAFGCHFIDFWLSLLFGKRFYAS